MNAAPAPLQGRDYGVAFEADPGGLAGAFLFRTQGVFSPALQAKVFASLAEVASGDTLNLIADTRSSENDLDLSGYESIARALSARGIRHLNVVVCDLDPGRHFIVRFGNEVLALGGVTVEARIVHSLAAAVAALGELMRRAGGG